MDTAHTTTIFIRTGAQHAFVTLIYSLNILSDICNLEDFHSCVSHCDIENNKILNDCEEDSSG